MSFLLLLRPVRPEMPFEPTPAESATVGEHFAYLRQLRAEGKLVLAGPSAVAPGDVIGIGVFDVEDEEEIRRIVAHDPAVSGGVMSAEIRPLRISVR
jgi:uncharacterized protein